MKQLPFVWKRLVVNHQTCDRCGGTLQALQDAIARLSASLAPLGIQPVLETQVIESDEFKARPSESNRVWILGKPLEDWLGARAGASTCCSVCGDAPYRTLELNGHIYETIPAELFIRAGLTAAAELITTVATQTQTTSCCGPADCCAR